MPHKQRNIMVTSALLYANAVIHLGHVIENIQADIWVRFQKLRGNRCLFIGGTDAHGTPVMISAQQRGISPEELVTQVHADHYQDFQSFLIEFDNFYTTHSSENAALTKAIYLQLKSNDDITTRQISQAYDTVKEIFLADRFIRGQCPKCGAKDQYGDSCEVCGATYNPMELVNPLSTLSGVRPIEKESLHYFFKLDKYTDLLKKWGNNERLQPQVANKLSEWFDEGLKQWDISRDAPYFGFEIPDAPGKYFYVWLDAPVGYMASLKNLCSRRDDLNFDDYWSKKSTAELYHFIGKDIIYFHSLFWPAMLEGAQYRLPTAIRVHGFLTINGQKMSKSRGTFITAKKYLQHLNPEYLRYYFAAKLNSEIEDIDLNLNDFVTRVNSDLVGKYINLASRCAGFITKHFNNRLSATMHDQKLFNEFVQQGESIAEYYEQLNFNRAIREIMALADRANQYIDQHQPWKLAKDPNSLAEVQIICTQGLNLFMLLTLYLKAILPKTATNVEEFLNCAPLTWQGELKPILDHEIRIFKPLMQRITIEDAEKIMQPETNDIKIS